MSAPVVRIGGDSEPLSQADIAMTGGEGTEDMEIEEALEVLETQDGEDTSNATSKPSFVDLLRSPIIEVSVGGGSGSGSGSSGSSSSDAVVLTAHEALLQQSPFFATAISAFSPDATSRRVEFPDEDTYAMGAFLQYLYTEEYTPRKQADGLLEGMRASDALDDGAELLRHARVYTLADKLGLAGLKALAHSKVHRINSSAQGEIAYARYVYAHTKRDDADIRKPIASFWGQRSHVLRHEAEQDFRDLCIEFPEFGFDVLSYVLDARERKGKDRDAGAAAAAAADAVETPKTGRKRARPL